MKTIRNYFSKAINFYVNRCMILDKKLIENGLPINM